MKKKGVKIDYLIGTMIELPRAALIADEIAKEAEFFSFGTNDLTQTTFGFSRDDAGKFISYYTENEHPGKRPLPDPGPGGRGPARQDGRGEGPRHQAEPQGRHLRRARRRPGERGVLLQGAGLNYVSCSPYRVPIARLAAAQAKLKEKGVGGSGTK